MKIILIMLVSVMLIHFSFIHTKKLEKIIRGIFGFVFGIIASIFMIVISIIIINIAIIVATIKTIIEWVKK